jgi:hypothetical protein
MLHAFDIQNEVLSWLTADQAYSLSIVDRSWSFSYYYHFSEKSFMSIVLNMEQSKKYIDIISLHSCIDYYAYGEQIVRVAMMHKRFNLLERMIEDGRYSHVPLFVIMVRFSKEHIASFLQQTWLMDRLSFREVLLLIRQYTMLSLRCNPTKGLFELTKDQVVHSLHMFPIHEDIERYTDQNKPMYKH